MRKNRTILKEKIKESLLSVIPVTGIVLLLCFTITPIPNGTLMAFVMGAVLLILGMGFFTLGAEIAMTPMGEAVGSHMTRTKKLWVVIAVSLFVGIMITISEPDLQVLAEQVPNIPNMTLILCVAVGVGLFLVLAMLRILFRIRLSFLLIGFYAAIFLIAAFVSPEFIAVSFDSGGVTTGPMTVPFIMALGIGVSSIRSDKNAESDSFGLVALCSIGPILAVLILGVLFTPGESLYTSFADINIQNSKELWALFANEFPRYVKEIAIALAPIVIFFLIYQFVALHLRMRQLGKMLIGVLYTYVGLVLFLTGANVGFMPVGNQIGKLIGELPYSWIMIPIGATLGYFIVTAEPAVYVLTKQVEEVTSGLIPKKAMEVSLSVGVAISVALSMVRVYTGLPIFWFLVPGYLLALCLTFFVPDIFTSIAFDSGGVASGPMTATFLLAFSMGACEAIGGNIVTDAFGIVAMVAMTPLITIQVLGLIYRIRLKKEEPVMEAEAREEEEIIELSEETSL